MKTRLQIIYIALLMLFVGLSLKAQPERKHIRQGNSYYHQAIDDSNRVDTATMAKAIRSYQKAIEYRPTSVEARFNLANARLKAGDYQEAEREYRSLQNAIVHDTIKAKIFHNLGNAQLYQGKIKESIEAYKSALRLKPDDLETKYNLAFAQSKLKQMQNQQQNQGQDNQQEQNDQQQTGQQQQGQQQQAQQQQAQQAQENPAEEDETKQDDKRQKFSKEDAARILDALQHQEQNVQDKLNKQQKKRTRQRPSRDW